MTAGTKIRLEPRHAGPGAVHLWVRDDHFQQDERAMRDVIAGAQRALGPRSPA